MNECPLCAVDLSDREFERILLEDRHGTGEPPADSTKWIALQRTLREEHDVAVSVSMLREHANEHVGYV